MQIFANLLHRYKTLKLKYMHSRKEATYHQVIGNFLVGWKKDRLARENLLAGQSEKQMDL